MRATFMVIEVFDDKVFIVDTNGPLSVTNDADAVVEDVNAIAPNRRIIYRDSMGAWDELCHTNGRFDDFAFYNEDLPAKALNWGK